MPRVAFITSALLLSAALNTSAQACLIPAASLTEVWVATTECPTWVKGSLHTLPDANTHFALSTGAYRTQHVAPAPLPEECLSLSVSICGSNTTTSATLAFTPNDPSPAFIISPTTWQSTNP
ncbi:MAG: hypothetical protein KGS45_09085 [Planctomycetes bacterium]|nr:hypothetical protein [Planctomycetota bacterium]